MAREFDEVQSKYWCITDHRHLDQVWWQEALDGNEVIEAFVGQVEESPSTKKLHVQGFMILTGKRRAGVVRKWFPGAHIELMRARDPTKAWDYCMKDESRAVYPYYWSIAKGERPKQPEPGKRSDLEKIRDLVKAGVADVDIIDEVPGAMRYLKDITSYRNLLEDKKERPTPAIHLRPWQEDLVRTLDGEIQQRRIIWLWSPYSAVGKTTTMQYYMALRPGSTIIGTKSLDNLLYAYKPSHRVIWFDFSRSNPLDAGATDVLEQLSNGGYLFAGKYQSTQKYVSAHVVVTCNRSPPVDRLPMRCAEWRLSETGELVPLIDQVGANWYNPDAGLLRFN